MKTVPDDLSVADVLDLKSKHMLAPNPEYQRGAVWTPSQKKKLVDSVLRGYPIPLIYFHHIKQAAGGLVSERFEIIDGQQRINALADYHDGAFKLFDPVKDEHEARFPEFIKRAPCPWGGKAFADLSQELKDQFRTTQLRVVKIETHDENQARDLFVRLQAGMPLNSQEKRDAWPGQFTDFVLRLGGKADIARYPGHDFFNDVMRGKKLKDRGKMRQLAAQIAALLFTKRATHALKDINAASIDDFYYENLGFDATSENARRLHEILDRLSGLLRDKKRPKVIGHEAIHLVLLVDSLLDDYTRSWESSLAGAFDTFRENLAKAKRSRHQATPDEYWLRYGEATRVNTDRADTIQRRHEFFATKMYEILKPVPKDPQRVFGLLERELIYYGAKKRCAVCDVEMAWDDVEIHHVQMHSTGGKTTLSNGAPVHKQCHPKGASATEAFAKKWAQKQAVV